MTNRVYIATSLDGYIATPGGGLDWLYAVPNPNNDDYGYADFIEGIDAIVMGRNTFEKVMTFDTWPYNKPVFVLSNSLAQLPEAVKNKAEKVSGDLRKLVQQLGTRGYSNLYIDGGSVIRSFLAEDLIDEMTITTVPVLLGSGIPLFTQLSEALTFEHQKTEVLSSALVKTHYIRTR
ncbi:dihydrofolate reductase family protein [cf. Phormidesmis sp. LEGE 11477]|uniref:dihydrofolate reductase family protein n=1 Tax=cf. Phormidesmis sp. LEGE 11477 TaxID=1828680 RepID=UPI001880F9D5|nr:dihydrofolate reductase family protein [cf. Phormidesmis sp. LEGE 11477]MBE9060760.1 dihydrofolate reductase [cf. Phormidesmis sp. LEGE 11477]